MALRPWTRSGWLGLPLIAAGLLFAIDFARSGVYQGGLASEIFSAVAVGLLVAGPVFVCSAILRSYREHGPHKLFGLSLGVWSAIVAGVTAAFFIVTA